MPTLDELPAVSAVKMLLIGDSGSGKTGSLASLAEAGYTLRILDFDNGLSPLRQYTSPDARKRIIVEQCFDNVKGSRSGDIRLIGGDRAFRRMLEVLDDWQPESLDDSNVIVIDSLTFMAKAAMRRVLALNNKFGQNPSQPNWGDAQRLVENVLTQLYNASVRCNVIITAHIKYIGTEDDATLRGYPESLGKSLSPTIPRFFDVLVLARTVGTGVNRRRALHTKSTNLIELKVPAKEIADELPLETGLATLFKALRNRPHPNER